LYPYIVVLERRTTRLPCAVTLLRDASTNAAAADDDDDDDDDSDNDKDDNDNV